MGTALISTSHLRASLPWRLSAWLLIGSSQLAPLQAGVFEPSPRTIVDVTAILDEQKPDPTLAAKARAAADALPAANAEPGTLAKFYYQRAQNRHTVGRLDEAIADDRRAIDLGETSVDKLQLGLMRQFLGFSLRLAGDPRAATETFLQIERSISGPSSEARLANTYRQLVDLYIVLGNLTQAESYVRKAQALIEPASHERAEYLKVSVQSDTAAATGRLAEARGRFDQAAASYAQAETLRRQAASLPFPSAPPREQQERAADRDAASLGRVEARSGRIAESESDVRRALLNRLKAHGKYNLATAQRIGDLADLLVERGRYEEAEKLVRSKIEIEVAMGVGKDTQSYAVSLEKLATVLSLQNRFDKAKQIFDELEQTTQAWDPPRRERLLLNHDRIDTLYGAGRVSEGLAVAKRLLDLQMVKFGAEHIETAITRGMLAVGLSLSGHSDEANSEFAESIPILTSAVHAEQDNSDSFEAATRVRRMRSIVERYLVFLSRVRTRDRMTTEGFRLAETFRGHSVQLALEQSSARAAMREPALAELARREQDLEKQIGAQLGLLNNVLSLPQDQHDVGIVENIRAEIAQLRQKHSDVRRELAVSFPAYSNLIAPKTPSISEIQEFLKPDEALVSFYFGREASFVWAVPHSGPVAFAIIDAQSDAIDARIAKLRAALEPQAAMISDIPPFDLKLAYELYSLLLKPVEPGWKQANSLIVVTNGALGLLPFSLLPTEPVKQEGEHGLLFSGYRNVPWLARTHAVTLVPSAAALRTLRALPPGPRNRDPFIGFGDPYFSAEQAADADAEGKTQSRWWSRRRITPPMRRGACR